MLNISGGSCTIAMATAAGSQKTAQSLTVILSGPERRFPHFPDSPPISFFLLEQPARSYLNQIMKKENGILVSAKQVTFPFTYILECDRTPSIFCLVYNGVHLFFFISQTFLRSHLFRGLFKYSPFKWRKPFETNGCQVCS